MADLVTLIAGNICSGKSRLLKHIEEHNEQFAHLLGEEKKLTMVPEFIDPEALKLFYANRRANTEIFEMSCLWGRIIRHTKAKNDTGLYLFDRGALEGAETFCRNSFEEGFLTHSGFESYTRTLRAGLDQLDRTTQGSWLEQLVVYLKVTDVSVLQARHRKRKTEGEELPAGYLELINDKYERLFTRSGEIYTSYGLRTPKVITVDASVDFKDDPLYHQRIVEQMITELTGMKKDAHP